MEISSFSFQSTIYRKSFDQVCQNCLVKYYKNSNTHFTLLFPKTSGIYNFYSMSYLYFGAMATSSVVLVGLIVSYATGNKTKEKKMQTQYWEMWVLLWKALIHRNSPLSMSVLIQSNEFNSINCTQLHFRSSSYEQSNPTQSRCNKSWLGSTSCDAVWVC